MEKYIKKVEIQSVCISTLLIILGIFMICKPVMTMGALVAALGYILIVDGIIHVISYFSIDNIDRIFNYELAQATIDIIMGFVLICNTASFTLIFNYGVCINLQYIFFHINFTNMHWNLDNS